MKGPRWKLMSDRCWNGGGQVGVAWAMIVASIVATALLMGAVAGAAQASMVTNVSVTNTSPTDAAGARTVYSIGFTTSLTGGLSTAQNSTITITFTSGTGFGSVNSSAILTANNTNLAPARP